MSFGDPRCECNEHVVDHFAPLFAVCASRARLGDKTVGFRIDIYPTRAVTIPFYPDVTLEEVPPEGHFEPATER